MRARPAPKTELLPAASFNFCVRNCNITPSLEQKLKEETAELRAARRPLSSPTFESGANSRSQAAHEGRTEETRSPLGSSLPPGWKKLYSRTKSREYYKHIASGECQWHPPLANSETLEQENAVEKAAGRKSAKGTKPSVREHCKGIADGDGDGEDHAAASRTWHDSNSAGAEAEGSEQVQWKKRALQAEAAVKSLAADLRAQDKALMESEHQLLIAEQSLQSLAAKQRSLLADAHRQASNEQRLRVLVRFAENLQKRSSNSLVASAFGNWMGAVKERLETAMAEALQLTQAQLAACQQELANSKQDIQKFEHKIDMSSTLPTSSDDKKLHGLCGNHEDAADVALLENSKSPTRTTMQGSESGLLYSRCGAYDSPLPFRTKILPAHEEGPFDRDAAAFERRLLGMSGMIQGKEKDALLAFTSSGQRNSELEEQVDALTAECNVLRAQVAEGLEQCKVLPTDLAQVNSLEAAWQSKLSEISVLQAENDALLSQKSDLNSKLFDVQEVASVRQQQLTQMHQTLKQLKRDTKKLKSENQEVEALKEEVSHLKLDIGFVQREAVEERLKRSQLVEQVELVLASAVDQLQSMRAEINNLQVCIIYVFSRMPIVAHKVMHGEREG